MCVEKKVGSESSGEFSLYYAALFPLRLAISLATAGALSIPGVTLMHQEKGEDCGGAQSEE